MITLRMVGVLGYWNILASANQLCSITNTFSKNNNKGIPFSKKHEISQKSNILHPVFHEHCNLTLVLS